MGAACPACGLAIVPGYVKCPRCHGQLPRIAKSTLDPSGTALPPAPKKFPVSALAIAITVAGIIVAVFALRRHDRAPAPQAESLPSVAIADPVDRPPPAQPRAPAPIENAPSRPPPETVAASLERSLRHAHLWATVEVVGNHADVRSGSCNEPALRAALEGSRAAFKASGLTRVRCLEQSGVVVFSRDL